MVQMEETDEQKRAKNLKKARRAIYLWPVMFLLYVGCLCLFLLDRHKSPKLLSIYDVMLLSAGLLLAAYAYSDAKYTIRTNGKERTSPGMAFVSLLFMGSRLGENISKHGLQLHLWPWILGLSGVVVLLALILRPIYRKHNHLL